MAGTCESSEVGYDKCDSHSFTNIGTPEGNDAEIAISCRDLTVRYGDLVAVDSLNMNVFRGECFGLLGPNGAGKTTTVEAFEGLLKPFSGRIEIFGQSWGGGNDRILRRKLGVALQETQLMDKLTVSETVRLFRSFYPSGRNVDECIDILGLNEKRRSKVEKLSGGQRQRLTLACSLVGEPKILFLDEPTTGLDPQARLRIWEVLEKYIEEGGTVLLTTHYMEEAARLCHRVAIIDHGKLMALDTTTRLIEMLGADQIVEITIDGDMDIESFEILLSVKQARNFGSKIAIMVEDVATALPGILGEIGRQEKKLLKLTTHQATLDDVFVHLTGRGLRDE